MPDCATLSKLLKRATTNLLTPQERKTLVRLGGEVVATARRLRIDARPLRQLVDAIAAGENCGDSLAEEVVSEVEYFAAAIDDTGAGKPAPEQTDVSAYIPAKDCRSHRITTHKKLTELLKREPGIRSRHKGQHLFVHAGDWHRWEATQDRLLDKSQTLIEDSVREELPRLQAKKAQRK